VPERPRAEVPDPVPPGRAWLDPQGSSLTRLGTGERGTEDPDVDDLDTDDPEPDDPDTDRLDAEAVLRRLAVAQALARGTAAARADADHRAQLSAARAPAGARWHLRPASLVAVVVLVILVAGAGWWLSRPEDVAVPYSGAAATSGGLAPPGAEGAAGGTDGAQRASSEDGLGTGAGAGSDNPATGAAGLRGTEAGAGDSMASSTIEVHVVGAVREPGLVTVSAGARVGDAVLAAGGLTGKADQAAVNLARVVRDGEQIVVPRRGEHVEPSTVPGGTVADGGSAGDDGSRTTGLGSSGGAPSVVNLNTADAAGLDALPGIGPALAQRIIDWRTQNGGFSSAEQLMEVSGIGDATFARLRDLVTV